MEKSRIETANMRTALQYLLGLSARPRPALGGDVLVFDCVSASINCLLLGRCSLLGAPDTNA